MSNQTFVTIAAFLIGLVLGSFLNVVIARLPKRLHLGIVEFPIPVR